MHTKLFALALPLALVTAFSVAPSAGSAPFGQAALNSSSYVRFSDAPGDSGAAPDITDVDIGNDVVLGPIVIWITLANRPNDLAAEDDLVLYFNTDRDPATGDEGSDYAIAVDADSVGAFQWDGTTYAAISTPSLSARFSKGDKAVRVAIHPNDLGGASAFEVYIEASTGEEYDGAPNGPPKWPYTLSAGPLRLSVAGVLVAPKRPVTGKTFAAALSVIREDINEYLALGKVRCTLRARAQTIRSTRAAVVSGVPLCLWKVPKSAAGKLLRGTISVTYGGATAKRSFSVRVR